MDLKRKRRKKMSKIINILNQEGQLVVTSRQISDDFEKEHAKVTRDIENLIEGIAKSGDTYKGWSLHIAK